MLRVFVATLLATVLGCDHPVEETDTTSALACGEEVSAQASAGDFACAWERQFDNIRSNGTRLSSPAHVIAAGVDTEIVVTHQCSEWVLGKDDDGAVIFISETSGEVRSHGAIHSGFPLSREQALPLPIRLLHR